MDSSSIIMIAYCGMMSIMVIAWSVAEVKSKGRKKEASPEPPPAFTSLSLLAGLSFFSGLGAILLAAVAGVLTLSMTMSDVVLMTDSTRRQVDLAARIVLYVSLLPAVGAAAFGLAARGVISESRGAVRGRPLYRTGFLLALVTGVLVFNAKILNPATWTVDGSSLSAGGADVDQGYLGVELGTMDSQGYIPVIRVVPGSPAERAGLKAGDPINTFDGMTVQAEGLANRIRSLKPGSKVTIGVIRRTQHGNTLVNVVAELAASFDSLLRLVKNQSFDVERMSVLKAAGSERRYSADELRRICAAFDFDEGRLKVIETSLPHLQDPQNAYQILGALDFQDAKKKASGWIEALPKPK